MNTFIKTCWSALRNKLMFLLLYTYKLWPTVIRKSLNRSISLLILMKMQMMESVISQLKRLLEANTQQWPHLILVLPNRFQFWFQDTFPITTFTYTHMLETLQVAKLMLLEHMLVFSKMNRTAKYILMNSLIKIWMSSHIHLSKRERFKNSISEFRAVCLLSPQVILSRPFSKFAVMK